MLESKHPTEAIIMTREKITIAAIENAIKSLKREPEPLRILGADELLSMPMYINKAWLLGQPVPRGVLTEGIGGA